MLTFLLILQYAQTQSKTIVNTIYSANYVVQKTTSVPGWIIGPFFRPRGINPVLKPIAQSNIPKSLLKFDLQSNWQDANTFNPAAVVYKNQVVLLYRAESNRKLGIGQHTSRIGIATSSDGLHFKQMGYPVVFPDDNSNSKYEILGGCEDPRVVYEPKVGYIMTYTGYNRKIARLCIASSKDLIHWHKYGPAFANTRFLNTWSKSGAIVCHLVGNILEPVKIKGVYWMYWGDGPIHIATSSSLLAWKPMTDKTGLLVTLIKKRPHYFDSALVESGPPAVLTSNGIVLIYNGKNADKNGDPTLKPDTYSAGQVLIDPQNPTKVLDRLSHPFLVPSEPFEQTGQYKAGTVFTEGLVLFKHQWHLYFGEADSFSGVATTEQIPIEKTNTRS